jgi:molecular chaperone HtpG
MEEKKSVVGTNEKVSNYIYDDIVFSVLSKLPFKSLKRFECTCKSWSLLFENYIFMNMFRNNFLSMMHRCSYHDQASLLLLEYHQNCLYSLSRESFENIIKLDFSNPFEQEEGEDGTLCIFDSINGTLCLYQQTSCKLALWNQATNEYKHIPPSPVESYIPDAAKHFCVLSSHPHGFGYDRRTCDYKVIRHVYFHTFHYEDYEDYEYVPSEDVFGDACLDPLWEIYSLKSNSWKKLDVDMPHRSLTIIMGTQVYMDGVSHWLSGELLLGRGSSFEPKCICVVSFDLSTEVFFTTPIPSDIDDMFDVEVRWKNLFVSNGSITLISYHENTSTFHISILGELGIKESWTRLFIVKAPTCIWNFVSVGTKGRIFLRREDGKLTWFDLSTQKFEEFSYNEEDIFDIEIYKEIILETSKFAQN